MEKQKIDDYEIVPHSKLKHAHSFIINVTYRNFHLHSDFELVLVLAGRGTFRIRDSYYELQPMDTLIINQNELHEIKSITEPFTMLMIQFSRHFCSDYFPALRHTVFNNRFLRDYFEADAYDHFTQQILRFNEAYICETPYFNLRCVEYIANILYHLYTHTSCDTVNEGQYKEWKKRSERLNRISAYIDLNYLYPIRLTDLAEIEGISPTHMSHFFTENFGITFQQYLTSKRIEEAIHLCGNKEYSAYKISELSGFSDPKYLNKAFMQHFGCSFKDYRKLHTLTEKRPDKSYDGVFERYLSFAECQAFWKNLLHETR